MHCVLDIFSNIDSVLWSYEVSEYPGAVGVVTMPNGECDAEV